MTESLYKHITALNETINSLKDQLTKERKTHTDYVRASTVLRDQPYASQYEGEVGVFLAERKQNIAASWKTDTSWSDRTEGRDYDATDDFVRLTRMIDKLIGTGQFERVVEIGCGDAMYLEYLAARISGIEEWIATDIESQRLERARKSVSRVRVEAADLLQCLDRYNEPGTLFIAANVSGSIAPHDMFCFFRRIKISRTGLALLSGGLSVESPYSFVIRPNGIAFNHNFFELIRASGLTCLEYEINYDGNTEERAGYWIAALVP